MTTVQVHLLMGGIGLLAILLLAGIFRKPSLYKSQKPKPWLSILAGIGIAASPLSRFWRNTFNGSELLTQSLLVSAIFLLALLLLALLLIPLRVFRRNRRKIARTQSGNVDQTHAHERGGLSPIAIDADANNIDKLTAASTTNQAVTSEVEKQPTSLFNAATYNDPLRADNLTESNSVTMDKSRSKDSANDDNRISSEKLAAQKLEAERVAAEKAKAEKLEADRLAAEKAQAEKLEADRLAAEKAKAEKLEAERVAAEKAKTEKLEADRLAAEKAQAEKLEAEKLAAKKAQEEAQTKRLFTSNNQKNNSQISTGILDERISNSNAANDKMTSDSENTTDPLVSPVTHSLLDDEDALPKSMRIEEDSLDLSETEQLFAEIRAQKTEVQLPDDKELKDATQKMAMNELDFDTTLVEENGSRDTSTDSKRQYDQIEEAEVLDIDDSDLEFGNDLTGEYAHPSGQPKSGKAKTSTAYIDTTSAQSVKVPETLNDAMLAAKMTAVSVQSQVSDLEDCISEVEELQSKQAIHSTANLKDQQAILVQKNQLIDSEEQARRAAESVIAAQTAVIDRTRAQKDQTSVLLTQERQRRIQELQKLKQMQQEVERSRKMARTAAQLARKAAIAQQEIRNVAKREQSARLKSQESTRKAVSIARNAISALAAEERKRTHTRH